MLADPDRGINIFYLLVILPYTYIWPSSTHRRSRPSESCPLLARSELLRPCGLMKGIDDHMRNFLHPVSLLVPLNSQKPPIAMHPNSTRPTQSLHCGTGAAAAAKSPCTSATPVFSASCAASTCCGSHSLTHHPGGSNGLAPLCVGGYMSLK
jgi:hypothetical protein